MSQKRYRYTGMERDEETGLSYHHHRYYATWLGRWTSSDPIGIKAGPNRYSYSRNQPTGRTDESGLDGELKTTDFGKYFVVSDHDAPLLKDYAPKGYTTMSKTDFTKAQETWDLVGSGQGSLKITARISKFTPHYDPQNPKKIDYYEARFTDKVDPGFEVRTLNDMRLMMSQPEGRSILYNLTHNSDYTTYVGPDRKNDPRKITIFGDNAFVALPLTTQSNGGVYQGWYYLGKDAQGGLVPIPPETDSVLFGELLHEDLDQRALSFERSAPRVVDPIQSIGKKVPVTIPASEAQTHLGVYVKGKTPATDVAKLHNRGLESKTLEYTDVTENTYRWAMGYRLRATYGIAQ